MTSEPDHHDMTRTGVAAGEMLPEGARLADRYRIEKVLGAGGMGVVYRAHDEQLDAPVALKVLRAELRPREEAFERFRQEIRLARKVTHPKVVRLHDIGRDGDIVFLTMDAVEGATLRERLADGPLSTGEALAIARDVAEALAAAHACGVVHRDVKPANILTADGHAKLSDFGVAHAIGSDGMTAEGAVAGTADYLAPEQIRGDAIDGRADIYALGLVLHEMLTGAVPLRGETIAETAARRAAGRSADLSKLAAPAGVRRIVARCLEPNPDDRYRDAAELAADLARGGAALRLKRNAVRGALAASVLILAGGAVWLLGDFGRPAEEAATAPVAAAEPAAPRIAVLPFENATGETELDWVRRGLAETLSNALAENPNLQPIDSLRVFRTLEALRFPEGALDAGAMRQLAALLDVKEIVTGRVIGEEGARRLEVVLREIPGGDERRIDVAIGESGLLAAAEESVVQVLAAFRVPENESAQPIAISGDAEAMSAYDEGIRLLARGESVAAVSALERSVAADAAFGAGWSALSYAYLEAGRRDEALTASEKAVGAIGAASSRAGLMARAHQSVLSGDPQAGFELYKEIVSRFPNDETARVRLAEQLGGFGQFGEAIDELKIVVGADPNHPRAWYLLGRFAVLSGDARAAAEDYLVRALIIQNRIGDAQGRGEVFNAMGLAHERLGELDVARQHYRNAAELREAAGDRRGHAGSLANIARLDMIAGDYAAAREGVERSLAEMTAVGDLGSVADMRTEFGVLEEEAGRYPAALEQYREALRLRRELGGEGGLGESYVNLAFVYLVLGEFDSAASFTRDARAEQEKSGDRHGELMVLELEGELALARGDWADAARAYVRELELSRELDAPFSEAVAEGGLALAAYYQGRAGAALAGYQRALDIVAPMNDIRGLAEFTLRRAALFMSIALPDKAATELAEIEAIENEGNLGQRAEYHRLQGAVLAAQGRSDEAKAQLQKAFDLSESSGSDALMLKVDLARLRYLARDAAPDPSALAARAERLGHAAMRLESLELLAERKLQEGDAAAALDAVRTAQRPPARIESWAGNWRLDALLQQALLASGGDAEATARAEERMKAGLSSLIEEAPADLRTGLEAIQQTVVADADVP